jgi:hypothetical protein
VPRFGDGRLKGLFAPDLHWQLIPQSTEERVSA